MNSNPDTISTLTSEQHERRFLIWVEYLWLTEAKDRSFPGAYSKHGEWIPRPEYIGESIAYARAQHRRVVRACATLGGGNFEPGARLSKRNFELDVRLVERAHAMSQESRAALLNGRSILDELAPVIDSGHAGRRDDRFDERDR